MPRRKSKKNLSNNEESSDDDKPVIKKRVHERATRQSKRKLSLKNEPVKQQQQVEKEENNSSDDEPIIKKKSPNKATSKAVSKSDSSSSESDIETYLQPINKIDLNSPFFNLQKDPSSSQSFDNIEKKILSDVSTLTDSESDFEGFPTATNGVVSNSSFQTFINYTKKMEEAKNHIQFYNAKKEESEMKDSDILNMLACSEPALIAENKKQIEETLHSSDFESCSDSEKEDWEEVKTKEKPEKSTVPKESIQITVDMPNVIKKKKGTDILAAMKRRFNRIKKENQVHIHKVHLLCWIAHGNYVNSIINSQNVLVRALSLLPSDKCFPADETDLNYLKQIVGWYTKFVNNVNKEIPENLPLEGLLKQQIKKKEVYNNKMLVLVFVAILRSLGIQCRLVFSLQTLPLRPPASELCSLSSKSEEKLKEAAKKKMNEAKSTPSTSKTPSDEKKKRGNEKNDSKTKNNKETVSNSKDKYGKKNDQEKDKSTRSLSETKVKKEAKQPNKKTSSNKSTSKDDTPKRNTRSNSHKVTPNSKTHDKSVNSRFFSTPSKTLDVRNDILQLVKGRIDEQKQLERRRSQRMRKSYKKQDEDDEDEDEIPIAVPKKEYDSGDEFMPKVKKRVQPRPSLDIITKNNKKTKIGVDFWVEVFLEKEDKWICADLVKGQVNAIKDINTRATHPIVYILAWNNDNSIKDITRRYCENFNTITRKLRVDPKWWEATLKPYQGIITIRDRVEDCEMDRQQQDQPLPKSITEYKNHPLYVLKRHLLKFEGIYPPDTPPLGYVRKEAVYPRKCVYTLHSRDIWLKHAKVVKLGETPYKIVKARPKYDKLSNSVITDQMLEIFGPWQTEDYVPPTAENGIVPRNAFGNVELFKECMLPKKTVHLKLPGLNKIARKLNIDCASAIVGFDFHGGWSHPTYDGFVVCEEFKETLEAAWHAEQEEIEKRESEKIEKRVYGNWKKLIKGLLIRERLNARYEFGESNSKATGGSKKKVSKATTKK